MSHSPRPDLWDSFWADHASSDKVFHRLLWRIRFLFSRAYARRLWAALPEARSDRLLEVGCGSARTLHYLHERWPASHCFALDKSPEAIKVVGQISPGFLCMVSEAESLPLAVGQFRLTFSIGLIEHFDRATAGRMVGEMVRVTETGGLVAVMVPWRNSLYNLVRLLFGKRWPFGPEQPFTRPEIARFMSDQGLAAVQVHTIYFSTVLAVGKVAR
ncbi:MAG: class I SAM-dependent methyltransferase [Chloroflexi bacterium]|nr:class I SAM-dependent methyltransferase [Chloroflexota bacterium]